MKNKIGRFIYALLISDTTKGNRFGKLYNKISLVFVLNEKFFCFVFSSKKFQVPFICCVSEYEKKIGEKNIVKTLVSFLCVCIVWRKCRQVRISTQPLFLFRGLSVRKKNFVILFYSANC